jgi:hypothetical protein
MPVKLGHPISYPSFGKGTVVSAGGSGGHARLQVNFEGAGSKWLVASYANLTPLWPRTFQQPHLASSISPKPIAASNGPLIAGVRCSLAPQLGVLKRRLEARLFIGGIRHRDRLAGFPQAQPLQDVGHLRVDHRKRVAVVVAGGAGITQHLAIRARIRPLADNHPETVGGCCCGSALITLPRNGPSVMKRVS